jgi:hypothetical protein
MYMGGGGTAFQMEFLCSSPNLRSSSLHFIGGIQSNFIWSTGGTGPFAPLALLPPPPPQAFCKQKIKKTKQFNVPSIQFTPSFLTPSTQFAIILFTPQSSEANSPSSLNQHNLHQFPQSANH